MCGIAGYCLNAQSLPLPQWVQGALGLLRKRGPDDEGICLISRAANAGQFYRTAFTHPSLSAQFPDFPKDSAPRHDVAFAHTRYAIFDLSPKGHQPFVSRDGSIIAVFNGEIYNHLELRKELSALGCVFQTTSDTEVLVEGYARWKDDVWPKLNGFWAVALYDRVNRSTVLCRDRMGVAPLYYRQTSRGLFFSSYIEPLVDIAGEKSAPDQEAVTGFIQTGFKDIDHTTCYADIKSVPSATSIHLSGLQSVLSEGEQRSYWRLPFSRLREQDLPFEDAVKQFRGIFLDAVALRLRADVKVAFELSGGLDSSSVVAAAALAGTNITTYTAKIDGADEESYARSMLKKYKLDYRVLENIEDDFTSDYAGFSWLMEEPYDNPNDYTHYRMLKAMKEQGVQVVVTGAGGDEVCAGYESSFWPRAYQEWRLQSLSGYIQADWHEFRRRFRTIKNSAATLKHYLVDPWKRLRVQSGRITSQGYNAIPTRASRARGQYPQLNFDAQRRFHFTTALLPYYMRSSDHFAMGIPVEHRFPFLDFRLVEFGLKLPISYLFRNGWTKYILRKAMEPYLPKAITWRRRKMGFQFPYRRYLTAQSLVFAPLLRELYRQCPQWKDSRDYQQLIEQDPLLLWRLISTAIWIQHNVKDQSS